MHIMVVKFVLHLKKVRILEVNFWLPIFCFWAILKSLASNLEGSGFYQDKGS